MSRRPPCPQILVVLVAVGLVVASAAGCGNEPRKAEPDAKVDPPETDVDPNPNLRANPGCDGGHADEINAHLVGQCELSAQFAPANMPTLELEPRPRPDGLLTAAVDEGGQLFVDYRPAGTADLTELLRTRAEATAEMALAHGRPPMEVRFALEAHADAPATKVKAMLAGLHEAGIDRGMVLLASKNPVSLPQPRDKAAAAKIVKLLEGMDPSQRATTIAAKMEPLTESCKPLVDVFRAVATVAPEQKCELFARGTAEALVECGCPTIEDELLTLIWVMTVGAGEPHHAVPLPVRLDPTARTSVSAQGTWAQAATELVAGADLDGESAFWLD